MSLYLTIPQRISRRTAPCPDRECACQLWAGCRNSTGYGVIGFDGKCHLVHRVAWEQENGPIPAGLTIDHVKARGCQHKHCINLAHLEPVTVRVNNRRARGLPDEPVRYVPSPDGTPICTAEEFIQDMVDAANRFAEANGLGHLVRR